MHILPGDFCQDAAVSEVMFAAMHGMPSFPRLLIIVSIGESSVRCLAPANVIANVMAPSWPLAVAEHEDADGHNDHPHDESASGAGVDHPHIDADAALDEDWSRATPGLPAILVKPKSIADAYKLRQDYRSNTTLAVFPGEVLTNLYATLGDAKRVLVGVMTGAQVLVAAAILLVTILHVGQR